MGYWTESYTDIKKFSHSLIEILILFLNLDWLVLTSTYNNQTFKQYFFLPTEGLTLYLNDNRRCTVH